MTQNYTLLAQLYHAALAAEKLTISSVYHTNTTYLAWCKDKCLDAGIYSATIEDICACARIDARRYPDGNA